MIYSIHVTTFDNTAKQSKWNKAIIIFRRSFSSIFFWTQDINNDKTILPAKGTDSDDIDSTPTWPRLDLDLTPTRPWINPEFQKWIESWFIFESVKDIIYFVFYMLLRIIYIVVLWVFVDQVFLDSEGLYQIPDLTALDTRHNIFISGSFSNFTRDPRTKITDFVI